MIELPDTYLEYASYMNLNSQQTVKHMENTASHCMRFTEYLHQHNIATDITPDDAWDAGLYHDVGKFYMLDIINLPRKLTDEEYRIVKKHPNKGMKVLDKYGIEDTKIKEAVRYHHESYSGMGGYPGKCEGEDIPMIARIVSICDVYEALYSKRAYKTDLPYEQVKVIMDDMRDKFDPVLFDLFFEMMDERIFGGNKR